MNVKACEALAVGVTQASLKFCTNLNDSMHLKYNLMHV